MSTLFQAKAKLSWSGAEALAPVCRQVEESWREKTIISSYQEDPLRHSSRPLFPKSRLSCTAGFLKLGTIGILGGIILYLGGCPVIVKYLAAILDLIHWIPIALPSEVMAIDKGNKLVIAR